MEASRSKGRKRGGARGTGRGGKKEVKEGEVKKTGRWKRMRGGGPEGRGMERREGKLEAGRRWLEGREGGRPSRKEGFEASVCKGRERGAAGETELEGRLRDARRWMERRGGSEGRKNGTREREQAEERLREEETVGGGCERLQRGKEEGGG